ncbi:hypothetical protein EDD11_005839 [Mortierella claussenii]|nr:hypothetical protein EDD11_005839 [Mortierella claussenii]
MDDLNTAFDAHPKLMLEFYSESSQESKRMAPQFEQRARDPNNATIRFLKVNVDELEAAQERYEIKSVPTFLALHSRELLGQCQGAAPENLDRLIANLNAV